MSESLAKTAWLPVKLGDLVQIIMGQAPPGAECNKSSIGAIFVKAGEFGMLRPVVREWTTQPLKFAKYGDVLICVVGATAGKINLGLDCAIGRSVAAIRPYELLDQLYLYYFLSTKVLSLRGDSTGSAQGVISKDDLASIELALPSISEQHRIVAKIEELFSELDKGVDSLKTAREQLKVYRQALLKHAFEGKLTAQWRAENSDKLETATVLQKRIQTERQERHRQQLADWEAKGKHGSKPKVPKPLPPLTTEELAELPGLPAAWGWIKYGDLCSLVRNGISAKPEGNLGTPIFRISAVRPLFFDMTDIRHIENSTGAFNSYCLERGDIVFTRYNGSRHYVGVCAEYRSDEKRLFPDKLVQTRTFSKLMSTSYLEKALNSGPSRQFVESKIRTTAGQSGVSGEDIKNIPVPICSPAESPAGR